MPSYLVERYLPGRDRAWLEAALARLPKDRRGVAYLGSTYVPSDESCFCRFEAASVENVRDANEIAGVPFARIVTVTEFTVTQRGSRYRRRFSMTRSLRLILAAAAVAVVGGFAAASQAQNGGGHSRSGALHATKDCSQYFGHAGDYCTIRSSSLKAIDPGMRVVYTSAAGAASLDSDLVLDGPGNNNALGHVTLDFATLSGVVTFNGGTGRFRGFHASVDVSYDAETGLWRWDGTYSFTPPGHDLG